MTDVFFQVFIYHANETSKGDIDIFKEVKLKALSLSNKFDKVGNVIKWHSIKMPMTKFEHLTLTETLLDFVVLDSVLKKIPSDSLVLLGRPNMEVRLDYFNRVSRSQFSGGHINNQDINVDCFLHHSTSSTTKSLKMLFMFII